MEKEGGPLGPLPRFSVRWGDSALPEQWSQHVPVQGGRRRESRGIFRIVPGVDRHESEIFGRSNKRIVLPPLLSFRIDAAMAVVIAPRQRSSGLLGYNAWNGQ